MRILTDAIRKLAADAIEKHASLKNDRFAYARTLTHWQNGVLSTQDLKDGTLE
jgi:hypothetical protein